LLGVSVASGAGGNVNANALRHGWKNQLIEISPANPAVKAAEFCNTINLKADIERGDVTCDE